MIFQHPIDKLINTDKIIIKMEIIPKLYMILVYDCLFELTYLYKKSDTIIIGYFQWYFEFIERLKYDKIISN